ncbi:MAG: hypothetical protein JO243_19930 [Solirubrobacterales bacterium]|nr:hypothetical protein [Solirubrobacterales bacterium]
MRRLWLLAPLTAIAVTVAPPAASAAPGSLDPSFGRGGIVITNGFGTPSDAILDRNKDILVTVNSNNGGPNGVLRYLPNGALDSTFGRGGFAALPSGNLIATASGIAVQSDGNIVVSSSAITTDTSQVGVAVARLTSTGSPDTSFGDGGIAFADVPGGPGAGAVVEDQNGNILVGGSFLTAGYRSSTTTGVVVRFTKNGQPDTTFGSGGAVSSTALGGIQTLGVDPSGDVFVLPAAAEISATGAIIPTAAAPQITASSQGGPNAFLSNGQSLRTGSVFVFRGNTEVQVRRFQATGALDSSFTSNPFHYLTGVTARDGSNAIAIEPNGDVVVGGSHWLGTAVLGLARLTPGGSLDPTFGSQGVLTTTVQGDESVGTLLAQGNNIVAVGFTEDNSTSTAGVALARYLG